MKLSLACEGNEYCPPMDEEELKWAVAKAKKAIRSIYKISDGNFKVLDTHGFGEYELQFPEVANKEEMKKKLSKLGFEIRGGWRYGTMIVDLLRTNYERMK